MKYHISKKISSGAFGTVYEGYDSQNQKIAIKQLYANKKVLREVNIHSRLNHPNVVKLFEYQTLDQISLYMEYCEYDLQQFIQQTMYPLKGDLVRTLAYQILQGLVHIHENRIIHRDLKPSNIMINTVAKIGDFGSAELLDKLQNGGIYSTEGFSKWYMAPEQLFGSRNYGPEVDIWSFACVYAEILQGLPLFTGKGEIDQIIQIGNLLGAPNPENWPNIATLPDFGKIDFKNSKPQSLEKIFDLASKEQISFLSSMLKYQDRPTAKQLLESEYFENMIQVPIPGCSAKEQYNPNYKYQ